MSETAISTGDLRSGTMERICAGLLNHHRSAGDEWRSLLLMIMRVDWKLDLILEELEIDSAEEED